MRQLGESKSAMVTPRSVPVMVISVPPLGGPERGEKFVMTWVGHWLPVIKRGGVVWEFVHSASMEHMSELAVLHQPHSKVVVFLVPTQVEQIEPIGLQSYTVTIKR